MGNKDNFTATAEHYVALNGAKFMIDEYELDYDSSSMDEFLNALIPNITKNEDFMDWFFFNIQKWNIERTAKFGVGDTVVVNAIKYVKKIQSFEFDGDPNVYTIVYYMTDGTSYFESELSKCKICI